MASEPESEVILSSADAPGFQSIWTAQRFEESFTVAPGKSYLPAVLDRLFSLVEALCLYDRLWFAGARPFTVHDPIIALAIERGILVHLDRETINDLGAKAGIADLAARTEIDARRRAFVVGLHDPNRLEMTQHMMLSEALGIPLTVAPDRESACTFIAARLSPMKEIKSALANAYQGMSDALKEQMSGLLDDEREQLVPIPPIPAIVLSECRRPEDIPDRVFALREKLAPVRSAFARYVNTLNDSSLPLKTRSKAKEQLATITADLAKPYSSKDVTMVSEWKDLGILLDPEALSQGKVVSLLAGKPLAVVAHLCKSFRVLRLYGLRKRFLKLRGYEQLVPDVFSVAIDPIDVEACERRDADYEESLTKNAGLAARTSAMWLESLRAELADLGRERDPGRDE